MIAYGCKDKQNRNFHGHNFIASIKKFPADNANPLNWQTGSNAFNCCRLGCCGRLYKISDIIADGHGTTRVKDNKFIVGCNLLYKCWLGCRKIEKVSLQRLGLEVWKQLGLFVQLRDKARSWTAWEILGRASRVWSIDPPKSWWMTIAWSRLS